MDKEIRRHYTLLVDFLGHILGPDFEVALHELTEDSNQIIAISNGNLTGRHLGSPLSNKMLEFLSGRLYETQDYVARTGVAMLLRLTFRSSLKSNCSPLGVPLLPLVPYFAPCWV